MGVNVRINDHLRADARLLDFLEDWEAYVGYWYDDLVPPKKVKGKLVYQEYKGGAVKGTLTIGIGHTAAAKAKVPFVIGGKMSHAEARRVLDIDIDPCEAAVRRLVKVPLTMGQFRACTSIIYNIGEGAFAKSSILKKLNAGNYAGARAAFALYNKAKGKVLLGLKRRRAAEQAMWDEDDVAVETMNPTKSEETMEEVVPKADPEPDVPVKSVLKSTEAAGSATQTGLGGTGVASEVDKALAHADRVIEVKDKAEQFGVEPISLFGKLGPVFEYLIHSPFFWISFIVMVIGIYLFFRRKWRLAQEL